VLYSTAFLIKGGIGMTLYRDMSRLEWLKALQMDQSSIPEAMICHGEWEHEENLTYWQDFLQNTQFAKWNTVIGLLDNLSIGFSNVYGSSAAANIVHPFAAAGTNMFIQTGYFGGLSHDLNYDDIFIVNGALMLDGVSTHYHQGSVVEADAELVQAAITYCETHGYPYKVGSVVSVSSLYIETEEMLQEWSSKGYLGVDMETATTLAIAKSFHKDAIGLLTMSDYIVKGETFYHRGEEEWAIEAIVDNRIRELAIYLSKGKKA